MFLNVSLCSMLMLVSIHFRDADLVLTEWNSVIGHYSVIGHIVSLKIMHCLICSSLNHGTWRAGTFSLNPSRSFEYKPEQKSSIFFNA